MPAVVGPESTSHLYLILLTMEGVYFLENIIYNDTLYVENWMPSIWHNKVLFSLCQVMLPQITLFSGKATILIQIFWFLLKMSDFNDTIIA